MNKYNKILNNCILIINNLICPACIYDLSDRIIQVNTPLLSIVKKANIDVHDMDVHKVLEISNIKTGKNRDLLTSDSLILTRNGQKRILTLPVLSGDHSYCGGIMVIFGKPIKQDFIHSTFASVLSKGDGNGKGELIYNGGRYKGLKEILNTIEKEFIRDTLNRTKNRSEAIKLLGVSRRTFYYKIQKYDL